MEINYVEQGREPEREGKVSYDNNGTYSHNNPRRIDLEDLGKLTMADYNLSPEAIKTYMYGMTVADPATGKEMGDEFYNHILEAAIAQTEQKFDIAIIPRLREEHHDYRSQEFNSYMHTHVYKRPILQVEDLKLELSGRPMRSFPSRWWKVYPLFGHIEIMPSPIMSAANGGGLHFAAPVPGLRQAHTFAPQMIHVDYVAGMLPRKNAGYAEEWEMPANLEKYILKMATKEIFQVWGRLIFPPGMAGTTLSMDGVSETINTTQSAMYSTVSAYLTEIDDELAILEEGLKSYYGSPFTAV